MTAAQKLKLAERHLERVQAAWDDPTDWDDLSLYGFYCLEAAVEAAALEYGYATSTKHHEKAALARQLSKEKGLPDVSGLLRDLNEARKATGYGDVAMPHLDAEDVARQIEEYVTEVENVVSS